VALQQIRLSQIKADISGYLDFEQQLIAIFGDSYVRKYIAIEGQTVFDLDKDYANNKSALRVFVNGVIQYEGEPSGWNETDENTIEFLQPLKAGDIVILVYNTLPWYSNAMSNNRITSVFNIVRSNAFITADNADQVIFDAPISFVQGINQVSVYANGIYLINGASFDYVELSTSQIRLNATFPVGTNIMIEVITGGLNIFTRDVYPYIITSSNSGQTVFTLPKAYKVNTNAVKVYRNGILLRKGLDNDYIETDEQTITMNYPVTTDNVITFEMIHFNIDAFQVVRNYKVVTEENKNDVVFTTPPYVMGESMLRVYLNGIMCDQDISGDYIELSTTSFRYNKAPMIVGSVLEYEVTTF
jgi:hypothetical protein